MYLTPTLLKFITFFFNCYVYVFTNTHIHTYTYVTKYINTICSVHILVCIFSGLITWNWTTNWCLLPWRSPFLLLWALLGYLGSFSRVGVPWVFCVHICMLMGVILIQVIVRQSCWWDFMGIASDIYRRHNLAANSLFLWLLPSSCPFFHKDPWVLDRGKWFLF